MIEAKIVYRARCDVCREPFGPELTEQCKPPYRDTVLERYYWLQRTDTLVGYDGPHVCLTCETKRDEQSLKIVNGCLDQSLHDNLIGMGIKKEKGETK